MQISGGNSKKELPSVHKTKENSQSFSINSIFDFTKKFTKKVK
jgi:hypothetical protein